MRFTGKYHIPARDTVNYRVVSNALRKQISDDQVWLGEERATPDC